MAEQTDARLQRAMEVIVRIQRIDNPKTVKAFEPFLRKDAQLLLEAIDGPEPDWADLREMARNAGWSPDTWMARDVHWGERDPKRSLRTDLGWVSSRHFRGRHLVELHGPEPRPIRTVMLVDPSPAEVLAAARLVGLGGAS